MRSRIIQPVAVGIAVDEAGIGVERAVDLRHLAGHRAEEVGHRLDGLDHAERRVRRNCRPTLGRLTKTMSPSSPCA